MWWRTIYSIDFAMKTFGTINIVPLLILCLVSLVLTACAQASPVPAPTPTSTRPIEIQVIPKKLKTGMRATMVGLGFERGEQVLFYFVRPDGSQTDQGQSMADQSGGAAYQVDVQDDWLPGNYVAHVRSIKNPARRAEQKIELLRR